MSRKIKFIWDFRGPDAKKIATHHCIHLNEYIKKEKLSLQVVGDEKISEIHHIAFMLVDEVSMKKHRDALQPHRGQVYTEKA
ncbi:hypothetical protein [Psychroflexus maritimus]|uniref:Uncharacterized protein n=1 Tax=Psychroflexus maritimus TaxID=2714865 RepID=A0A967E2H7_9FLAO|nr:hypothetical protein [Psychroflexus maritimus]NGZ89779.1 hypothetical protein [Psychroflexus maritimus]